MKYKKLQEFKKLFHIKKMELKNKRYIWFAE